MRGRTIRIPGSDLVAFMYFDLRGQKYEKYRYVDSIRGYIFHNQVIKFVKLLKRVMGDECWLPDAEQNTLLLYFL